MEKECNRCKKVKDVCEFPKRTYKSGKIGTEPNCLECKREVHRKHQQEKRAKNGWKTTERAMDLERRRKFPEKEMYARSKKRAQSKGLAFTITVEDITIPTHCPLIGIPLAVQTGGASDNSPSLDRIDTTRGYVPGNVAVISRLANIMKAHADEKTLMLFVKNIPEYIGESPSDNKPSELTGKAK